LGGLFATPADQRVGGVTVENDDGSNSSDHSWWWVLGVALLGIVVVAAVVAVVVGAVVIAKKKGVFGRPKPTFIAGDQGGSDYVLMQDSV
jgi:hypothetical protein